jgi:O-antigen ligase
LSFSNSSGRSDIWSAAWRFFTEGPVFGHGLGSFTTTSPNIVEDFVTSAKYGPAQPGVAQPTSSAHNVILQVLAEGGVVGFAIVAWSVYFLLRASWHAVILPVLIAILVDSLFDTFAYVVQVSWVLGLVFAVGLKFRSSEAGATHSPDAVAASSALA